MDAIYENESVCIMSCAQIGKSLILTNVLGYYVHLDKCSMLFVQPTQEAAETFSKERLAPMIRDNEVIKDILAPVKSRSASNTLKTKTFAGGFLAMVGANSPTDLCSRPIRILLLDEVDRYPGSAGTEGDPVMLAEKRTANFWNRRKVYVSTPGVKGMSRIESLFLSSDQRRYNVPCPFCRQFQILEWNQLRYVDLDYPMYECKHCGELIAEKHKGQMLTEGKWVATEKSSLVGFHINSLYSPWRKWHEIVSDFLKSKDNPDRYKTWVNTDLGEPFAIVGDVPSWELLYDRREVYEMFVMPKNSAFLTAGIDVQGNRIEIQYIAWGRNECWSIGYEVVLGKPDLQTTWNEVWEKIGRPFQHESGTTCRVAMTCVDSGFSTNTVYSAVRRLGSAQVRVIKGQDELLASISPPRPMDVWYDGSRITEGIMLWRVGSSFLKQEIYGWLKLRPSDPHYVHFPQYDEGYFRQLTAEQLMERKDSRGFTKFFWEKVYDRNEALDTFVYARAAAAMLGWDTMTDKDWDSLYQKIENDTNGVKPTGKKKLTSFI